MKDNKEHILSLGQIEINTAQLEGLEFPEQLPVLPTRDFVMFPGVTFPISLGRDSSIATAEKASRGGSLICILCQHDANDECPRIPVDLYKYGVVAKVIRIFDIPDGPKTAILHAIKKVMVTGEGVEPGTVTVNYIEEIEPRDSDKEFAALAQSVRNTALSILRKTIDGPNELSFNLENIESPVMAINMVATHTPMSPKVKQELLKLRSVKERGYRLLTELASNEQMVDLTRDIQERTKRILTENQKANFLQTQMEAIRQELYGDDDEATKFRKKAYELNISDEVRDIFDREIDKLSRLNPQSPDYSVQYGYLELLVSLPWNNPDELNKDLIKAEDILNADHYGLEKVKERIIEQIAVMMNRPDGKSPILCLVGAPGVGKTSLGQSIAKALGRKYQRVSLGGLHDESEIRGHRRTYIGAMPGRIIDAMKRAGSSNPVLLLDEIDKIGNDIKGDPAAALLEVLDPEQNCHFHDNYVDVDYDLSNVLFIATANTLATLSQPLLDRMEIIDISGYLQEEKVQIARRHLIPRILAENGFKASELKFSNEAIEKIIENYTSESGVRQLEKKLAAVVRKVVLKKMRGQKVPRTINATRVRECLGVEERIHGRYENNDYAGVVTGLAWTAVGGEILFVEASLAKGKGEKLTLTGNLGDVMKESAVIALQYVRSHSAELCVDPEILNHYTLHLHVPEGAIPKDGPSAGITMATAIVSALTQCKVRERVAMTGEITLRGKVLPVGGIKEKILAAKRAGIDTIILSADNRKDIEDIPAVYLEDMKFVYVSDVREVIKHAILTEKVPSPMIFDVSDK